MSSCRHEFNCKEDFLCAFFGLIRSMVIRYLRHSPQSGMCRWTSLRWIFSLELEVTTSSTCLISALSLLPLTDRRGECGTARCTHRQPGRHSGGWGRGAVCVPLAGGRPRWGGGRGGGGRWPPIGQWAFPRLVEPRDWRHVSSKNPSFLFKVDLDGPLTTPQHGYDRQKQVWIFLILGFSILFSNRSNQNTLHRRRVGATATTSYSCSLSFCLSFFSSPLSSSFRDARYRVSGQITGNYIILEYDVWRAVSARQPRCVTDLIIWAIIL